MMPPGYTGCSSGHYHGTPAGADQCDEQRQRRAADLNGLDTQPAATELQALLGVPDATEPHGVQLPDA